jgi:hypothetical protein
MAARQIGLSKFRQAQLYGDRMPSTLFVDSGQDITDEMLDVIAGDQVVLKADKAQGGQFSRIGVEKGEARALLADLRAEMGGKTTEGGIVMQEMAPGRPLHGLRAINPDEQVLIDDADPTSNYELGVYCFADCTELRPSVVYRLHPGVLGKDRWVTIDQESAPEQAFIVAQDIIDRTLTTVKAPGILARVDLFSDGSEGGLRVREVNTRDPDLGIKDRITQHHARLLGAQLATLAQAHS